MKFTGIKVIDHQLSGFDYNSSDVSKQKLLLGFDNVVRNSFVNVKDHLGKTIWEDYIQQK
jgi:hypothetical protein